MANTVNPTAFPMTINGHLIELWVTARAANDNESLGRCEILLLLCRNYHTIGIIRNQNKPLQFDSLEAMLMFWHRRIKPHKLPVVGIFYRDNAEEEILPFCMTDEAVAAIEEPVTVPSE
jgi:hypothetical protein